MLDDPLATLDDELEEIGTLARPLRSTSDLDPLLDRIGDARLVLLGEASHGTAEHYRWRAEITRRLLRERGFSFVAVEGDWPDCFAVDGWVKDRVAPGRDAREVLSGFDRWPTWMWANEVVADFVEDLRELNRGAGSGIGFYGLDVYSLWESLEHVLDHLAEHRPEDLAAAHDALRCFEPFRDDDPSEYGRATRLVPVSCEDEVVELLTEVHGERLRDGDPEAGLDAVQNAEVLVAAERYYRTMMRADGTSWNLRDLHMADTLDRLLTHHGPGAKAVVWAHDTHVGDARATDMAAAGLLNLGQLVRTRHRVDDVVIVGFGAHRGRVVAADGWGDAMRVMDVPPARSGSHEDLIHRIAPWDSLMVFPPERHGPWLGGRRGHRAIGVVYRPHADARQYVPTTMGARYDALCAFEDTTGVAPLPSRSRRGAAASTTPWGT